MPSRVFASCTGAVTRKEQQEHDEEDEQERLKVHHAPAIREVRNASESMFGSVPNRRPPYSTANQANAGGVHNEAIRGVVEGGVAQLSSEGLGGGQVRRGRGQRSRCVAVTSARIRVARSRSNAPAGASPVALVCARRVHSTRGVQSEKILGRDDGQPGRP